jgi:phage shock protein A
MQSEASARAEVASTSIDSKLREMEVSQMDVEADRQLAELEAKMQMGQSPATNYTTTSNVQQVQTVGGGTANAASNGNGKPESDIDRQLRELEEKLGRK